MIPSIKEIGSFVNKKGIQSQRSIEGKITVININNYNYSGIHIEDFDNSKIKFYLYKEGASKGNNPTPFCPLTEPKKTFNKNVNWLKECGKLGNKKLDFDILNIVEVLNKQKETIIEDISQKIKDIKIKSNFLTVKINDKFLGEYEFFKYAFQELEREKLRKSANKGVCSVCNETDKEVSGKVNVFRFYTTDKPGFITGGFKEEYAWKNYPVCEDCKSNLEEGRKFLESNLNFKFYGLSYLLIPQLLIGREDVLNEIIEILSDTNKKIYLKERIKKKITNDENEILEFLSEENDVVTFNFLFLQTQQSAERILLFIEDVLPSRLRKIFETKDYVDRLFQNDVEKGFNFGNIRTFFSKSSEEKRENDLNKYFLEIVDSVFKGKTIEFSFLVKFFMVKIRNELIKETQESKFNFIVKDAMMSLIFFEKLGIMNFKEEVSMSQSIFEEIFTKYGKSLSVPAKRGIFLLGALTQLLLEKQWSERKSKPFIKKLKGLKMDERDIKSLLPEVQNKLEEYDAFDLGKQKLAKEIARYFLEAGENWRMSVDEINFYFACGMNLKNEIAEIIYKKEEI